MKFCRILFAVVVALATTLYAQQPSTLKHSIPPPDGPLWQTQPRYGQCVAVDGGYAVVGGESVNTGALFSGEVRVYHSATGALLHVIRNPAPVANDHFGHAVAISGTRLVVGAHLKGVAAAADGIVYIYDLAGPTPTVPALTLNNPHPAAFDIFGETVAISGTRLVVGASGDDQGASGAGRVYVYDLAGATPAVPVTILNNPAPAVDDRFGRTVAISGTRVVVGANGDDATAVDAGTVYVYELTSGTPDVPVFTLDNPEPGTSDRFGESLAVSGVHVVVGAVSDDTGASGAGAAYVYDLAGGAPTVPVMVLHNPNPAVDDLFGQAVAVTATRVIVGSHLDGAVDRGAVYLYELGGSTVPLGVLTYSAPADGDQFGASAAVSGSQLIVGALGIGPGQNGGAFVYDLSSGTPLTPVSMLYSQAPDGRECFGTSVAVSGTRMVVGAPYSDAFFNPGRAYVYDLTSQTPAVPILELINPEPEFNDRFGNSVAISGTRVLVGALYGGALSEGKVHVYDLDAPLPAYSVMSLTKPNPVGNDNFGRAMAISGSRAVLGAALDDGAATDAGSAYVYDLDSATPAVPIATLRHPSPVANDQFGCAVGISGKRVVVGACLDDLSVPPFTSNAGSAFVYDVDGSTPTVPVVSISNPAPFPDDRFGTAIAISGTRVVVGAFNNDVTGMDTGSVYVYDVAGVTPATAIATLNNPSPATSDFFGFSVGISGSRIVVGTSQDDTGATDAGIAYLYDVAGATPTVPVAVLNNPAPGATDRYGAAVAIEGTTVVIGAPTDDSVVLDKGYAYVFTPPPSPDIQVQAPLNNILVSGVQAFHFGIQAVDGGLLLSIRHRISNLGETPLTGLNLTIIGDATADFTPSALPPGTLAPGASFEFDVTFDATAPGARNATLSLASNDPDENPFLIPLSGTGLTAQEAWRMQYFFTMGNTGNAADTADPDGDGANNHFEFVAGLIPNDPTSRFQVRVEDVPGQPGQKSITFGPVIAGRTYVVTSKAGLADSTWAPLTNTTTANNGAERTVTDLDAGAGPKFYQVEITR